MLKLFMITQHLTNLLFNSSSACYFSFFKLSVLLLMLAFLVRYVYFLMKNSCKGFQIVELS